MTGHIYIYGEVGKQVTLESVLKSIKPSNEDYVVHIHSPGGDVFEGFAIYNALKNTGKEIEVWVEGQCASIAMSIASAASPGKLFSNERGSLMIHNPSFQNISGQSKDLRNAADLLDQIKSQFLREWQSRTGLKPEQLSEMYNTETWMTPEQAKDLGFVDDVKPMLKAVACADIKRYHDMKQSQDKSKILAMIEGLGKAITSAFSSPKALTNTLADGTTQVEIAVEEGEDWVGKSITYADGTPLPPGEYTLASGETVTVGENSTIAQKTTPESEDMKTKEELAAKQQELDAAKAKIAELESALTSRNDAAAKAEAKIVAMSKETDEKLKKLSAELEAIKTQAMGDQTPPQMPTKPISKDGMPEPNDPIRLKFREIINKRNTD